MAPRANWKGYLRLSLVSCPIALYPASSLSEKVSFNRINRKTGNRLKQDPTFAEAWYNLSDLLDGQGRSEAAIECLRNALRAAPAYIDAIFNLALLLQRNHKHAEAAEHWRRYLANDAQSKWAERARRSLKFCEMEVHLWASSR